jgi:hypothetical protein
MCCGLGFAQVKKRRQERELKQQQCEEDVLVLHCGKDAAQFQEWEQQENQFHLEHARLRSCIRIQDGRGMTNVLLFFLEYPFLAMLLYPNSKVRDASR